MAIARIDPKELLALLKMIFGSMEEKRRASPPSHTMNRAASLAKDVSQQLKNHPHPPLAGVAMSQVSVDLINRGGNDQLLGMHMLRGVSLGLEDSSKDKLPVCPNCGRRHR